MNPKVLIGCVTYHKHKYCIEPFLKAIKEVDYDNYDLVIVDNSEDEDNYFNFLKNKKINTIKDNIKGIGRVKIASGREILRKKANDYDYFLLLDQDVIIPKNIIKELISNKKDVISSLYFSRVQKNNIIKTIPIAYIDTDIPGKVTHLSNKEAIKDQIIKIRACGGGCLFLNKKAISQLDFKIPLDTKCGEDIFFCIEAYKKGFEIYLNTKVKCKHLINQQKNKWKDQKY